MLHTNLWITVYFLVLAGIFGAVFGSFINCMAWRIAHGESVWKGRSHCTSCGHALGAGDLVPVFSYLFLKGRCRYCREKISPRYMITELLMAGAFVLVVWKYDISILTLRDLLFLCILLDIALVDLEIYEIPNGFIAAGILLWLAALPFVGGDILRQGLDGAIGGFAIAGGLLVFSLLFDKILKKESLGGGDIKLFFVTGLYLGLFGNLLNLILACVLGILLALVLKKDKIPFGPAIAASSLLCILWGEQAVGWYLGLF